MKDVLKFSNLLMYNEWVSLYKLAIPGRHIFGYVFSHETRCNGNIIVDVPYRYRNNNVEVLVRYESVPSWELDTILPVSLTGGVDTGSNPFETSKKELWEESGYKVETMYSLGTTYGTKSTDTVYHFFTCDLTKEKDDPVPAVPESEFDKSYVKWHELKKVIAMTSDPFLLAGISKLQMFLNI